MSDLPIGIVTFLFTDIAGSSNLWEQHTNAMSEALPRHDAMLREAIESRYGVVFKTVGDGSHAVFGNASDALAAAVAAQRTILAEPWETAEPLRIRVALNTGVAELRGGDYFGPLLNRTARLLAAAHGGQISALAGDDRASARPAAARPGAPRSGRASAPRSDTPGADLSAVRPRPADRFFAAEHARSAPA